MTDYIDLYPALSTDSAYFWDAELTQDEDELEDRRREDKENE